MACLLAPTVPSEPSPQNLHLTVPACLIANFSDEGSERLVTSSTIETVKLFLGVSNFKLSNTVNISVGVVSLEPRPYLPPTIRGFLLSPKYTDSTSRCKGSAGAPGSLVLSSTAIFCTVLGIDSKKYSFTNGL